MCTKLAARYYTKDARAGKLSIGASQTNHVPLRYLHDLVVTYLSPSRLLPQALSLARQNLFPQNALPPPSPPPPTPEQIKQIKRQCAEAIISLLPPPVCERLLGPSEEQWLKEVEVELDVWEDSWMNKHLGYGIVELILVRVLPELGEKGVEELMEARLGVLP